MSSLVLTQQLVYFGLTLDMAQAKVMLPLKKCLSTDEVPEVVEKLLDSCLHANAEEDVRSWPASTIKER